jgi:sarcosine oxidase subunit beta
VIVGGGIVGTAAAYYLSRAGAQVTLLERRGLAAGASGACNGYIWLGTKKPGLHTELTQASLELLKSFVPAALRPVECDASGELLLVDSEDQRPDVEAFVRRQQSAGIEVAVLTRSETLKLQPALAEHAVVGAVYSPVGVVVNPMDVVLAFADGARAGGAEIRLGAAVEGIETVSGRVRSVRTAEGPIETDFVVNAAGVWAPDVGAMVGLRVPIEPQRGQIIVTEPIAPLIRMPTLQFSYVAVKRDPVLLQETTRCGVTSSVSQGTRGNVFLGSSKEFVGFDTSTSPEALTEIARKATTYYPALAHVRALRTYAGLRPYTSDGLPILGPVDGLEGFVMAAGHGGDGIALAAISGRLVADVIDSSTVPTAAEPLALKRFSAAASGQFGKSA